MVFAGFRAKYHTIFKKTLLKNVGKEEHRNAKRLISNCLVNHEKLLLYSGKTGKNWSFSFIAGDEANGEYQCRFKVAQL